MPKYNALGHVIPDNDTDAPDLETALDNLSLSNPGIIPVDSRAAANAIRDAYRDAAGAESMVNPPELVVWRRDVRQLEVETPSYGWEYLAGRQHGATVTYSSLVPQQTVGSLSATAFVRNSVGWTINSDGYLVIPQTGFYAMYAGMSVSGAASTMGRAWFQFALRSGAFGSRQPATDEDNWGGMALWPLSAGDQLRIQVYHSGGAGRTWSGTLQIAMLNAPAW